MCRCIKNFPRAGPPPLPLPGGKVSTAVKKLRKRFNLEKSSRSFGNVIFHYVVVGTTILVRRERELAEMALGQREREKCVVTFGEGEKE